jgi:hypothetical protein
MSMEQRVLDALQKKYEGAMRVAGHTLMTLTHNAIPVWRGPLRDSQRLRVNAWDDVDVITGNAETRQYAAYQYGLDAQGNESPLNHQGGPHAYENLAQGGADGNGTGDRAQYQRQYRKKLADGTLKKSAAKWYHRIIQDKESMDIVLGVFVRKFRS